MRFIFLFFFLFFLSCNSLQKKVYIYGDRPCIDKKEFNEYFSKNLVIEIKKDKNEKLKVIDLVKLNSDSSSLKNNNKETNKQDLRLIKKAEKEKLKVDKKQIFKTSKPSIKKKEITNSQNEIKNEQAKVSVNKKEVINKEFQIDSVEAKNIKSICTEIENCNIEKVAEILIKKGKDKPFPNIASN